MSVRRFCARHGLRRKRLISEAELEGALVQSIYETGPSHGRKFMTGYLSTLRLHAGEGRVGRTLRELHQPYREFWRENLRVERLWPEVNNRVTTETGAGAPAGPRGRGIPHELAEGGCPAKVYEELLPCASIVANMYKKDLGSSLTWESAFGADPFSSREGECHAEQGLAENYPDISLLFNHVVNDDDDTPLQGALIGLMNVTARYV